MYKKCSSLGNASCQHYFYYSRSDHENTNYNDTLLVWPQWCCKSDLPEVLGFVVVVTIVASVVVNAAVCDCVAMWVKVTVGDVTSSGAVEG